MRDVEAGCHLARQVDLRGDFVRAQERGEGGVLVVEDAQDIIRETCEASTRVLRCGSVRRSAHVSDAFVRGCWAYSARVLQIYSVLRN